MEKSPSGAARAIVATKTCRILLRGLVALAGLCLVSIVVFASNPSAGSIGPSSSPVTWTGTATGTGAVQDESTCVEGVNCDSFTLNISGSQSDWSKSLLDIKIGWTVPANDYDMFVHQGGLTGPVVASSANGAPETGQEVTIDPASLGAGTYTVHVCYWLTTPSVDQYVGTATVIPRPAGRIARVNWVHSAFSPNMTLTAPMSQDDGEPSSRCDAMGNYYVVGIRGVPAGVDLWHFDLNPNSPTYDPLLLNAQYRGQPDGFSPDSQAEVGADGGGDVDIAVGNGASGPNNVPTLAFSSLAIANVSVATSSDLGNSWTKNPAGNVTGGAPVDDRQWMAFYGSKQVYLYYRTFDPAVSQVQVSTDGGLSYGPATTAGTLGQAGSIDVDQHDGTVYLSGSNGQVAVGTRMPPRDTR